MRGDAAFRGHERRVGENKVGLLVPAGVVAQGVVDVDGGVGKAVEEEVHLAQLHHEVGDVVAGEVGIDFWRWPWVSWSPGMVEPGEVFRVRMCL